MRYFLNEIHAILCNRKLVLCFLLFLVLNAGLLTVYFDTDEIDDGDYLRIKTEMAADSEYIFEAYGNDPESETCKVLYQEYMACSTYDVYLENVIADARGNTQISIFQTKFAISNLEQTEQDFKKLEGTEPVFVGGYGITEAINFSGSYILIFFLLIVLVFELILRDKKNGLANLYKTTWHGDSRLLLSKYAASVVYLAFFVGCAFACNLLIARWRFGVVDFSAPVQSLLPYVGVGFQCGIGMFFVLACLAKIVILAMGLAILYLCVVLSSNEVISCIWIAGFLFVETLLKLIGTKMNIALLRRVSILEMLDTEQFFSYLNYNLASHAVSAVLIDIVVCVIILVLMLVLASFFYIEGSSDYQAGGISIRRNKQKQKPKRAVTSIWRLEEYKLWLGYKMIFVYIMLILLQGYIYQNKTVHWNLNDNVYRYYMKQIEGDITQEKLDYIDSEYQRFEDLKAEYSQLETDFNDGKVPEYVYNTRTDEINEELLYENGFLQCRDYVEYIKKLCGIQTQVSEADTEKLQKIGFVYNRGWDMLAGGTDFGDDIQNAVKLIVVLMLTTAFLYFEDYRYKIDGILDITSNYQKLRWIKAGKLLLVILVTFLLVYLPDIVWIYKNVGLAGAGYSAKSLCCLSETGLGTGILGYFVLVYGIRLLTVLVLTFVYIKIGRLIKSTNGAIFCAAAVVLLPLILYLSGIRGAGEYPLVRLLSGNMIWR